MRTVTILLSDDLARLVALLDAAHAVLEDRCQRDHATHYARLFRRATGLHLTHAAPAGVYVIGARQTGHAAPIPRLGAQR